MNSIRNIKSLDSEMLISRIYLYTKSRLSKLGIDKNLINDISYDIVMDALVDLYTAENSNKIKEDNLKYLLTYINKYLRRRDFKRYIDAAVKGLNDDTTGDLDIDYSDKELISSAIMSLGEDEANLIEMYYYEKLSIEEIASNLKKDKVFTKRLLDSALDKLKQQIIKS